MQIINDPAEFQRTALAWRMTGITTVLVPTMGALHAGHLSLIAAARERAGSAGRVLVTIFVNPIQFNSAADLDKYPRTLDHDAERCRAAGVDLLFVPTPKQMYPREFRTFVEVERLTDVLCGAHRPGHFRGVTTVVMKLFMLAQPTAAMFGWKDAQQFLVLRRMAADLALPLEMIGIETVREPDGLALSSRNQLLSATERDEANRIYQGLQAAQGLFESGEHDASRLITAASAPIHGSPLFCLEYVELRSLDTLEVQPQAEPGNSLLAVAAHLGAARLIDNIRF